MSSLDLNQIILIVVVVAAALAFDFINGFHDAANSIATVVSTQVLTPFRAVLWAAFFNVIAFAPFKLHVAGTIGKGIIDPGVVDVAVIIGALGGAIAWNLLTWWWGLPSSSSHALVGGLIGAGVSKAGLGILGWQKIGSTAAFIFLSPLIGYLASSVLAITGSWIFRKSTPGRVDKWFRRLQLVSSALLSVNHGGNDAQKTMGIITSLLFSAGILKGEFHVPLWVILSCFAAISCGIMFGGWRIVKTMGQRITKLRPVDGFCAETGAAIMLFFASALGIPVSTTHTITGSIMGVGSLRRLSAVKWGVAGRIVWAWIFTIPCTALISASAYWLVKLIQH